MSTILGQKQIIGHDTIITSYNEHLGPGQDRNACNTKSGCPII
jgi:hypothetical protein